MGDGDPERLPAYWHRPAVASINLSSNVHSFSAASFFANLADSGTAKSAGHHRLLAEKARIGMSKVGRPTNLSFCRVHGLRIGPQPCLPIAIRQICARFLFFPLSA
jgi:hypothetical protein